MSVSRETQLAAYLGLLRRWGKTLNLTSASHGSNGALRDLIDDCLCIVPHLPANLDRLIDLGSGQGLPAIPLAIETGVAVELIESDRRKSAFLTTVLATLNLPGTVHCSRIGQTVIPRARCVTARALAPLPSLVALARPFMAPDGVGLFLKGPAAATERAAMTPDTTIAVDIHPTSRPPSCLVKITLLG